MVLISSLTVLVGVIVGACAAILILTMVSCFCCSCCLLYKKRTAGSGTSYIYFIKKGEEVWRV